MIGNPYFWIFVFAVSFVISVSIARSFSRAAEAERANSRKKDEQLSVVREAHAKHLAAVEAQYNKLLDHARGMEKIYEERKTQFPWVASAIADFHALENERAAQALKPKNTLRPNQRSRSGNTGTKGGKQSA